MYKLNITFEQYNQFEYKYPTSPKNYIETLEPLSKLWPFVTIDIPTNLYYSLHSLAFYTYGLIAWRNTYSTTINPLFIPQKNSIRIIIFSYYREHTNPILWNWIYSSSLALFRPRPHYTVFKRKRYCFVPDTATVHTTTVRKRIVSKTLSRAERFENGTVWKCCFPSVDGENDTIWKRWRHHNNTTWL